MSGLPQLTEETWQRSLERALDASPHHVSTYDLQARRCACCTVPLCCFCAAAVLSVLPGPATFTPLLPVSTRHPQVEEGTPFARRYSPGEAPLPSDEAAASMYCTASHVLRGAGARACWSSGPPACCFLLLQHAPALSFPTCAGSFIHSLIPLFHSLIRSLRRSLTHQASSTTRSATTLSPATAAPTTWCIGRAAPFTRPAWAPPRTCRRACAVVGRSCQPVHCQAGSHAQLAWLSSERVPVRPLSRPPPLPLVSLLPAGPPLQPAQAPECLPLLGGGV